MEDTPNIEARAAHLSKQLEEQLHSMTEEFNQKVKALGIQYGIELFTEVSFLLETKRDQEGQ